MRTFKKTVFNKFNKYATTKKGVQVKKAPFMTKEPHKAITKRSRLRIELLKGKTGTNQKNIKLQGNICETLLETTKKVTDNKTFWKTIVLLFMA